MRLMRSYKKPREIQQKCTTYILLKTVAVLGCEKDETHMKQMSKE